MFSRWRFRRRCLAIAARCGQAELIPYLEACASTHVDRLVNTPLISVDLEMTGLDARQNQIIAIGWTHVDGGRVRFGSNHHLLINAQQSVGHTAAIHELLDNDVARGMPLEEGLEALFEAARGRVWVFHHAELDIAFLQQACLSWAGLEMPFMVLDTMQIELSIRNRRDLPVMHGDMQLNKLRKHYNLPGYTAHSALIDACATAELLLAMAAHLDTTASVKLDHYLNYL